ncbi:ABC transporter ATP-binding protein [Cohnella sp. GbtcB17]|uniref:ABC transporter ATP-binding protein n=1 Tax=Cohnella sp. GbtcB17 TaxID=2824762 RepID=UPI001C3090A9|nr:ATP-binding cassette domain-containing protein [Cohnella sp. GbtcB17]
MLVMDNVSKIYKKSGLFVKERRQALSGSSFEWRPGESVDTTGESGSGKSTLGRLALGIEQPDHGRVLWDGRRIDRRRMRAGSIGAVFQDYASSINPFYTVEQALREPLKLLGVETREQRPAIDRLLEQVGLDVSYRGKYPHELSGGEAQRVCIARAVSTQPRCLLLDEAVSALDGSVQVQILDLLRSLRSSCRMGYIFITHDIEAAAYLCDRALIMRNGRIEENIRMERLKDVQSPYARQLLRMMIR